MAGQKRDSSGDASQPETRARQALRKHVDVRRRQLDYDVEGMRQVRETFDQQRRQDARWFRLREVIGYSSIALLLGIMVISSYIVINHANFPNAVVTCAAGAFFVDTLGLVMSVWKIALKPGYVAILAPLLEVKPPSLDAAQGQPSSDDQDVTEEATSNSPTGPFG